MDLNLWNSALSLCRYLDHLQSSLVSPTARYTSSPCVSNLPYEHSHCSAHNSLSDSRLHFEIPIGSPFIDIPKRASSLGGYWDRVVPVSAAFCNSYFSQGWVTIGQMTDDVCRIESWQMGWTMMPQVLFMDHGETPHQCMVQVVPNTFWARKRILDAWQSKISVQVLENVAL